MRVSFRRLTDSNGLDIIVNPAAVRYLAPAGSGTTRICFDNSHTVNVRGSPRQVQEQLTSEYELHTFVQD
jgi:hypothetical protein